MKRDTNIKSDEHYDGYCDAARGYDCPKNVSSAYRDGHEEYQEQRAKARIELTLPNQRG